MAGVLAVVDGNAGFELEVGGQVVAEIAGALEAEAAGRAETTLHTGLGALAVVADLDAAIDDAVDAQAGRHGKPLALGRFGHGLGGRVSLLGRFFGFLGGDTGGGRRGGQQFLQFFQAGFRCCEFAAQIVDRGSVDSAGDGQRGKAGQHGPVDRLMTHCLLREVVVDG